MNSLRPLPSEIVLFARVLVCEGKSEIGALATCLLEQAEEARIYRLRWGRPHPHYGDGTLVARLMKLPVASMGYGDEPGFLNALIIVADAILTHNAAKPTNLPDG